MDEDDNEADFLRLLDQNPDVSCSLLQIQNDNPGLEFGNLCFLELARLFIRIKRNAPEITSLELDHADEYVPTSVYSRMGTLIGQNSVLSNVSITANDLAVRELCEGLQHNRTIKSFDLSGDYDEPNRNVATVELFSFVSYNTSLEDICICEISVHYGPLSDALLRRSSDTLKSLYLRNNNLGDIDMDDLVTALSTTCRNVTSLTLTRNQIGQRGYTSLAELLKNEDSKLESLDLDRNNLDDVCLNTLVDALANNNKLVSMDLADNNEMTNSGRLVFLPLVCDTSSIKSILRSNHTINIGADLHQRVQGSDVDGINLLRESFEVNRTENKEHVKRQKIVWAHAKGDVNVGNSSIPMGAIPDVLSWFRDTDNESSVLSIQYHQPPLPDARMEAVRIDSMFRILRSMPDLVGHTSSATPQMMKIED